MTTNIVTKRGEPLNTLINDALREFFAERKAIEKANQEKTLEGETPATQDTPACQAGKLM